MRRPRSPTTSLSGLSESTPLPDHVIASNDLSGLSAAHTVLERGGRVLVLDKSAFLGENSVKATSGINVAGTYSQVNHEIKDSRDLFYTIQQGQPGQAASTSRQDAYPSRQDAVCNTYVATAYRIRHCGAGAAITMQLIHSR